LIWFVYISLYKCDSKHHNRDYFYTGYCSNQYGEIYNLTALFFLKAGKPAFQLELSGPEGHQVVKSEGPVM